MKIKLNMKKLNTLIFSRVFSTTMKYRLSKNSSTIKKPYRKIVVLGKYLIDKIKLLGKK